MKESFMDDKLPDFFMVLGESPGLIQQLKCYRIKRFHATRRDDYLLIQVSPPVDGQKHGVPNLINELVIATRHNSVSLFPVRKWPVEVYVLRVLTENLVERDSIKDEELALIDWATIYDSQLNMY
jgi:hypothetical protein